MLLDHGSATPSGAPSGLDRTPEQAGTAPADGPVDQAARRRPELEPLLRAYFAHVPPADRPRTAADVLTIVDGHLRVGTRRSPGCSGLRIFNPAAPEHSAAGAEAGDPSSRPTPASASARAAEAGEDGFDATPTAALAGSTGSAPGTWSATSTVVDIVGDDMPFLVESVIGTLAAHGLSVQRIVHPILAVRRDASGALLEVIGESRRGSDPAEAVRESWIHLLVDRLSDAERAEQVEDDLLATLSSIRAVVTDGAAMIGAAAVAAADLRSSASPRPLAEVGEAADLLNWFTAGNLVFLGYARQESVSGGRLLTAPESLFGLFRADRDPADPVRAELDGLLDGAGSTPRPPVDDPEVPAEAPQVRIHAPGAAVGAAGAQVGSPGVRADAAEVPADAAGMPADATAVQADGPGGPADAAGVPADAAAVPADADPHLQLGQLSTGALLGRDAPPLTVAIHIFGAGGELLRRHVLIGMLTARARAADPSAVPVLRRTVETVLATLGATPDSYTGQRAIDVIAGFPRTTLFWVGRAAALDVVEGVLQLANRPRLRAFVHPDPRGRFVSVLVYLPRDRYTTAARLAIQQILLDRLGGTDVRYTARIGSFRLATVHFVVRTPAARPGTDVDELNRALRRAVRTWDDRLVAAVVGGADELDTAGALSRYADAFDDGYKSVHPVEVAVADLARLDAVHDADDLALQLTVDPDVPDQRRLKLYVTAGRVTLSRALPVLQSLGAEVIDERPFEVRRTDGTAGHIYDFGLRFPVGGMTARTSGGPAVSVDESARTRFTDAFRAAWTGRSETDGFNALVVVADLDWTAVAVLRAYARYVQQLGTPYTQGYLEQVLTAHPAIAADLARLFTARFDPSAQGDRAAAQALLQERITGALDDVASLDADRILRLFQALITATTRTNAFRAGRAALAYKLHPAAVPGMPKPVPAHEIWVYSPRVEGVHLRFGAVARGGLRWSDRREDFRTEILGLVKAQEVKNAVIVPVGAKGGFVLKSPPTATGDPVADREALAAEGVACYRIFVSTLLDLTDNRVAGGVVPPPDTVRHDGDDPYLVVAADKGTATFSDVANGVAAEHGFWLGDAFASGGSAGYDHKAMGITARGAWESVRHHFRELGIDPDRDDFTCVGIGDMSGDVFGNGMLLSRHLKLVAAFDHRHVFVDPDPDPQASFAERTRLFGMPRSSWADYDRDLISTGGGVWPRSAKSVPVSPQMAAVLGVDPGVDALPPAELLHRILLARVDLLWNGGIGTYVKAASEPQAAAGDKANDAIRVDGLELRARVVGEGGNLGVTQLGRIEYARAGGRINTDAIDNSAGVDTSDHEVNIKIALQPAVADGRLSPDGRLTLLTGMTDDIARLVLADNIDQNRVLGVSRFHAGPMVSVHARLLDALSASGKLDRQLEFLPGRAVLAAREVAGEGLAGPELAVLLAYVKSSLAAEILAGTVPDEPAFAPLLAGYFPPRMQAGTDPAVDLSAHPLARQIITTVAVNAMVNAAGITFAFRLAEESGADAAAAVRAFTVTSAAFGLAELWHEIAGLDVSVPADAVNVLLLEVRRLLDRSARWLQAHRPQPLDTGAEIDRFATAVTALMPLLPRLLRGVEQGNVDADVERLTALGAPVELARRVASGLYAFSMLDITEVAGSGHDLVRTAEVHFALSAWLDVDRILSAVSALPRGDRWHALARQALRDDLYASLRRLTAAVMRTADPADPDADAAIARWAAANSARLARAQATLAQIAAEAGADLASLSVAASEFRLLV